MNPDEVEEIGQHLESAILADDEEATMRAGTALLIGALTNLARIADALSTKEQPE